MKMIKILLALTAALALVYLLGPQPASPNLDTSIPPVSDELAELAQQVADAERSIPDLKPDNEARIIWADSTRSRTPYSVVYLHGFSASWAEGEPLHREFARRYGCNLYLSRLAGHGLEDPEAFADLTADDLLASAAEALAIGARLGENVILMSVSTGTSLSLLLAADHPDTVSALLTFSPNIAIKDPTAKYLNNPWGLQLSRATMKGRYRSFEADAEYKKYWYAKYRLEGLVAVQQLLEHGMHEATFRRVKQPFFMGYYYKNEAEQDEVVSVPAMLAMYDALGTPPEKKRKVAFADVNDHAMISYVTSEDLDSPRRELFRFAEEVLELKPVGK